MADNEDLFLDEQKRAESLLISKLKQGKTSNGEMSPGDFTNGYLYSAKKIGVDLLTTQTIECATEKILDRVNNQETEKSQSKLTPEEVKYDLNGDGVLSEDELKEKIEEEKKQEADKAIEFYSSNSNQEENELKKEEERLIENKIESKIENEIVSNGALNSILSDNAKIQASSISDNLKNHKVTHSKDPKNNHNNHKSSTHTKSSSGHAKSGVKTNKTRGI
jgi:hypothetical protein